MDKYIGKHIDNLEGLLPKVGDFAINFILALIAYYVGRKVILWICKMFMKFSEKSKWNPMASRFLTSFLKVVLYFFLITGIAIELGIKETSIVAVIASAGVGISLALQGGLSNMTGGVIILFLKPFEIGDYIIQPLQKNEGTVKMIDMFYTTLLTVDNRKVVIPNSQLTNSSLINATAQDRRLLEIKVSISYDSDIKKAKELIKELLQKEDKVMSDLPEQVFVDELGESAVVLGLRAWVKTENYWETKWHLNETIKESFDENHIIIPYPQMDVYIKSQPPV